MRLAPASSSAGVGSGMSGFELPETRAVPMPPLRRHCRRQLLKSLRDGAPSDLNERGSKFADVNTTSPTQNRGLESPRSDGADEHTVHRAQRFNDRFG